MFMSSAVKVTTPLFVLRPALLTVSVASLASSVKVTTPFGAELVPETVKLSASSITTLPEVLLVNAMRVTLVLSESLTAPMPFLAESVTTALALVAVTSLATSPASLIAPF